MSSVNKIILVGHLGGDPEVRTFDGGKTKARFNVATSERWTDKEGKPQEHTEWHRVVAWGRLAEVVGEYLSKGKQVYVEGRVRTHRWKDSEEKDRYMTEVMAESITFLGSREAGAAAA